MPHLQLGIFDWNGTLVDDWAVMYACVTHVFKTYNIPPPSSETCRRQLSSHPDAIDFYRANGLPHSVTLDALRALSDEATQEHWKDACLRDGVLPLIHFCIAHNIDRVIVSGERKERLWRRLREYRLSDYFQGVWSDALRAKECSKERALQEVLVRFGFPGEAAFYIDDTVSGIQAAKSLGITTFGFTGGYTPADMIEGARPTFAVKTLREALDVIKIYTGKQESLWQ